jgi:hypothetical protein
MSTITSTGEFTSRSSTDTFRRLATAAELLAIYAGILLYIWRWQISHRWTWMLLFAAILVSHVVHRDTLRSLGLTRANLRANAAMTLRLALVLYIPLLVYGFARHILGLYSLGWPALASFTGYGIWCVFQQYLMQSYFHNRLMSVVQNRHLSSLLVAVMFGGAHIPNPILMIATTAGGFILAEVFARYRNIWPLALAQTVGGLLVAAVSPASIIHNMRVGPGYFFYGLPGWRVRG